MRRITISISDDLFDALQREAQRRSVPAPAIAREALAEFLNLGAPGERLELAFAALGRSGPSDTARKMERLLEQEWDRHRP